MTPSSIGATRSMRSRSHDAELRFATILEHAPIAIAVVQGEALRYTVANPAYGAIAGSALEPLVGRTVREVFPDIPEQGIEALLHVLRTGERVSLREYEPGLGPEHPRSWWNVEHVPLADADGRVDSVLILAEEVTDQVLARGELEQAVAEAQQRAAEAEETGRLLDALMEYVPEGITIADAPDGRIRRVSRFGRALAGRPPDVIEGIPASGSVHATRWGLYHPDGRPAADAELPLTRAVQQGEVSTGEEWLLRRPDGSEITVLCNAGPVLDAQGRITGGLIAWRDITERKRAEGAARESERWLAMALDAAELGVWEWEPDGRRVRLDARAQALYGLPAEASRELILSRVHPEDRGAVEAEFGAALDPARRGLLEHEHRVVHPDGRARWVRVLGRVDFASGAADAAVVGALGTVRDVTSQKEIELAQRETAARYRATFEQAAVGIAHVGLDGRILQLNGRLCEILGHSPEKLLASTFADVTHPDDLETDLHNLARLAAGEIDSFTMEKRYVRADGSIVWANLTASAVRDEDGGVLHFIGIVEDISSRKEAEASLAFLAEAGQRLSASLDLNTVLETLRALALPRLGDGLVLDLLEPDGSGDGWRVAHLDAAAEARLAAYRSHYPPGAQPGTPIWQALDAGETVLGVDVPEDYPERIAADAEQARRLRAIWPRSFMIVPLVVRRRVTGAITFLITESDRQYTDAELSLARELAGRAAAAVENARLHTLAQAELEAAQRARAWTERLQRLSADFVQVLTPEEVALRVCRSLRDALGAHSAGILLYHEREQELSLLHSVGWSPDDPDFGRWRRFAARRGIPVVDALLENRLVTIDSASEFAARYPDLAAQLAPRGHAAYLAAPMEAAGRRVGVLNFTLAEDHHFTAEECGFVEAVAQQAARALDRAELFAAERRARADAETASRAKTQFLSTISHELRTPLTAVIGVSDLLETDVLGPTTERQKDYLSRMKSSAWHLVSIIDEILTYARTEAGKEEIRLAEVDVAEIARGVVALLGSEAQRKGVLLTIRGAQERIVATTDGGKVRQILTNLLGNALKFTDAGSVTVTLEADSSRFQLTVRDSGTGIPAERLEDIFEPFVQVDGSNTRTTGGAGLGLSICRRLARLLGGTVHVESALGAGSTFTLILPLRSAEGAL